MTDTAARERGHTPEPWHVYDRGIGFEVHAGPEPTDGEHWWRGGTAEHPESGECHDITSDGMKETIGNEANARRIVACVNICAGLSTRDMEEYVRDGSRRLHFDCQADAELARLRSQLADAHELLHSIRDHVWDEIGDKGFNYWSNSGMERARDLVYGYLLHETLDPALKRITAAK